MSTRHIGRPTSRVDGRAKVTGTAKYVAEFHVPELVYGVVVSGSIARGTITKIDSSAALAVRGVIEVLTHENAPRLARRDRDHRDMVAPPGSPFRPLQGPEIVYSGQPVALVLAESFELARHAAGLVRVEYAEVAHETRLEAVRGEAYGPPKNKAGYKPPPRPRGNADKAFAAAAVKQDATYTHAMTHHNPMETHATTVVVEHDGTLTIHDKTQGAQNSRDYVAKVFDLPPEQVRVIAPFIGGAFGSGLRPQYQLPLAVMAAKALRRSVRVVLTRQQMFTFGYRPRVEQRLALGSSQEGRLEAITHDTLSNTSRFEHYCENVVPWSGVMYQCDNVRLDYKIAQLDLYTPIDMRGPGAVSGVYALECAIDELADKLGEDPLALRLRNYAEHDQNKDQPFSSKALRECYQKGAEAFGWA
ncbi:MAG TPA: molybdopterin cofactor-binding domain-containing protein, partial [Nannocystis sp.]